MISDIIKGTKLEIIIYILLFLILTGCAGRQEFKKEIIPENRMESYLADKPMKLRTGFRAILEEGKRNYVLNNMRTGIDALRLGYCDIAKACFDNALVYIEAVFADNEKAKKARSLWYEEGMKDFKGEPYERAMVYYYRGLLYMMDKDLENARACFKSGVIQDAFAEENQYRCDFALLLFLEGYCSLLLGDQHMANAAFNEVKKIRPDFNLPIADNNLLIIVETGPSPRKLADGIGHGELKFFRGRNVSIKRVSLNINDKKIIYYPIEDIAWQAMTRGGRPVDKIIKGQVLFRKSHEKSGTALTQASSNIFLYSSLSPQSNTLSGMGVALGIFGVAEMALAARTRTHADTRYWDNLPDTVHIACLKLDPGSYKLRTAYLNAAGKKVSEDVEQIVKKNTITILWKRPGIKNIEQDIGGRL